MKYQKPRNVESHRKGDLTICDDGAIIISTTGKLSLFDNKIRVSKASQYAAGRCIGYVDDENCYRKSEER